MNIDRTNPAGEWCPVCSIRHASEQDVSDCYDRRRSHYARTGERWPLNFDEPLDAPDESIPFDGSSGPTTEAPFDGPYNYGLQPPF